jgi:hypothetical protein
MGNLPPALTGPACGGGRGYWVLFPRGLTSGPRRPEKVSNGRAQVLDGPFAEAKEMVGGFFLLDCATRDEAVAIARECPAAEWATVEVRATGPCYT